ncbi:hypothetical protein Ancab_016576 [Ancistrocladus abbreviatus]
MAATGMGCRSKRPSEKQTVGANFKLNGPTVLLSLEKPKASRGDFHHDYTLPDIHTSNSPHILSGSESDSLGPAQAPCDDPARGPSAHWCLKPSVPGRRDDSQRASSCPIASGLQIDRMGRIRKLLAAQRTTKQRHRLRTNRKGKTLRGTDAFPSSAAALPSQRSLDPTLQGLSIGDSCIENRNRLILAELEQVQAEEVWAIGKQLGLSYEGDEAEVLQNLRAMDARDTRCRR